MASAAGFRASKPGMRLCIRDLTVVGLLPLPLCGAVPLLLHKDRRTTPVVLSAAVSGKRQRALGHCEHGHLWQVAMLGACIDDRVAAKR